MLAILRPPSSVERQKGISAELYSCKIQQSSCHVHALFGIAIPNPSLPTPTPALKAH
jgi:hypothetical protein